MNQKIYKHSFKLDKDNNRVSLYQKLSCRSGSDWIYLHEVKQVLIDDHKIYLKFKETELTINYKNYHLTVDPTDKLVELNIYL